jgi:branched-chain amino acid transport system substrate-binding protein
LAGAANAAKSTDPKTLDKTLKSGRFETVLGTVGFDQKGDITAPGYVLYVWRNGSFDYAN